MALASIVQTDAVVIFLAAVIVLLAYAMGELFRVSNGIRR